MPTFARVLLTVVLCALLLARAGAQTSIPSAHLVSAPRLFVPDRVDSNMPMVWDLADGVPQLHALASWGGVPSLLVGPDLGRMRRVLDSVTFEPHPGHGIWIESVIADGSGVWYGYYHHEVPAELCGRADRTVLSIGAARSLDQGRTWRDLGIILAAPAGTEACESTNSFVLGGVGDLSVMLDADKRDLYMFFTQYERDRAVQGVAVARLAWADRDQPVGRLAVWQQGVWLPPQSELDAEGNRRGWRYEPGTPLAPATRPWHDGDPAADAFWGPSVHWNTYLEQYVMLLNRARNENFENEGIYVSFSPILDNPGRWTSPGKLMNGGDWYPQVVGLEPGATDKIAGQRARFLMLGQSEHVIEFTR